MENTLCHPTNKIITLGSDGSIHLSHQVAACTWMIHDSDEHFVKACFLLSDISSASSYRSELEGIFRGLKHVKLLNLTPTEIHQYCNNKAAGDKCMHQPWRPGDMIQADANIILAIHTICRTLLARGTTATTLADAVIQGGNGLDLPPTITCPLPGSRANLRIGPTWITSHARCHILWEHRAHTLRTYCLDKYDWNTVTFNSIAWPTI